jgi:hypothetical protein
MSLYQGWQSVTFLVRIRDFRIPDFLVKIDTDSRIPDSDSGFLKKNSKDHIISKNLRQHLNQYVLMLIY